MKKKIVVLLLLILAGMCIIASENGWCYWGPGWWRVATWGHGYGAHPWGEDDYVCARIVAPNEPYIESVNIHIDSSTLSTNTSVGKNLLKGGGETSTNFKKKEKNQVKLLNKL